MYTQPTLLIPPHIEAGLSDGTLRLFGSVVRYTDSGRILKHLQPLDIPTPEATRELVAQVAKSSKKKYALLLAGGGAVLVGGAYAAHYVIKKREAAREVAAADVPQCVTSFDESLRAYVEAGRSGDLNADILDQLIADLDAVKEFTASGNEVLISLESLIPLFDMVVAHTGRLADAYDVVLGDLDVPDSKDDVVVSLSRHLHAQRSILSRAA